MPGIKRLFPKARYMCKTTVIFIIVAIILIIISSRKSSMTISRNGSREYIAGVILEPQGINANSVKNTFNTGEKIPKILHQTWKSNNIPEVFFPWIRSWLKQHPDWEYWFWTDEDVFEFVSNKYGDLLHLYQSYPGPGFRADAFRYLVLYEYGGVYADLDMESLASLNSFIDNTDCFVSQEPTAHAHFLSPRGVPPLVSNAIMGCKPGHPFFQYVAEHLHTYARHAYNNDVLRATGPYMLTDLYRKYHRRWWFGGSPDSVTLPEYEIFQPSLDSSMVDIMKGKCIDKTGLLIRSDANSKVHDQVCRQVIGYDFKSSPAENSLTNHHWTHSWAGKYNDPWGVHNTHSRAFDIRDLVKSSQTRQ